jgi:hypothetical protein
MLLKGYQDGNCVEVWERMRNLGYAIRSERIISEVREVADETMRRCRRNIERIGNTLPEFGYDPSIDVPDKFDPDFIGAVERTFGPLPISLVAFWNEVGSIGFSAKSNRDEEHQRQWELGSAITVFGCDQSLRELHHHEKEGRLFEAPLFCDSVASGNEYGVLVPDPRADAVLAPNHEECFGPTLVLHLRRAFENGGFLTPEGSYTETNEEFRLMCRAISARLEPI